MKLDFKNKDMSALNILKRINVHLNNKRKRQVIYIFILSIFSSLSESISVALLIPFISFFINPETYLFNSFFQNIFDYLDMSDQKDIFLFVSILFVSIVLISGVMRLVYIKNSNKLSDKITSDFRIKIFNFLINQDYSYYFKHGTNEIMSNLTQKTQSFTTIVFAAMNIFNAILILIAVICVLTINEPLYTLIVILTIAIFFITVFKIKSRSVLKKGQNINLNQNIIVDTFESTVGYLQEVLVYNLRNFFLKTLTKVSKEIAISSSEIRSIGMTPRIYLETFLIISVVLLVYFLNLTERSLLLNISYLAVLAYGAQKCLPLVNSIYNLSISFKSSTPTVLSFLKILDNEKLDLEKKSDNLELLEFDKEINLEKIFFRYNKSLPPVLNNLNLIINKGEKIAIKGKTGTGKSTLINLILGLVEPTQGKLLIDGTEINSTNKKNWQKNIAIVPQTVFLNNSSILENIALGENFNEINFEKVKNSAKISCISDFIESLPNKYKEKVGEKGVRLSGGQKQRIGLARALYRDPNVLVLDEPSNALDLKTENQVMKKLTSLSKKVTIIMISHSDNSLKFFDRIFNLDKIS
ncbi:ABC transporter ATP-binding protein/permease [Pelagibacteraceae bacterium]|nr:ABC transporter ATP-binding protein/permease [Pelagibacteraceae bacterium]MDC0366610.1 ABC transporter ATP-binding protein/permease [Pelagibacteraceae bacterium]